MNPLNIEELFETVTTSFKANAHLPMKDSTEIDLDKVIKDTIYGLLSEESLTPEQVSVLSALMQSIKVK